ncbi:hypothetical protein [Caldisalinibacter kiritimatiensis]|uniref:Uncharacterized protein n=1 Tax=Caldisalinibacter kiritimatiensis TaxID=1304284 RepID=R1AY72_9FIRM|nr:hypothetical protein [Caldisalinibacter kiritimatiensis]EOD01622.1 hypothetical protein L21TH_0302 [Caldisalinibacter kiritimatiensis]
MFIWLLTVFVYVFFVYGIIAFIKNVYYDFTTRKNKQTDKTIEIIVNDSEDVQYYIDVLKKHFNHIILVTEEDSQYIREVINIMSKELEVEYKVLNTRKIQNS